MADFLIVGIGCSAGGLDPLQRLFSRMPREAGLAFVIAAHLDPTQESHLTELIGRRTELTVVQVEDSMKVEPDHVYVIAPDQELTIKGGVLHASKPTAPRGQRHPVDNFFRSLAEDQGERALAIVLSGTGTNGSQGIRFIKAEGGIVLAQEPTNAAFDGMPRSAVGTGVVDLVLKPEAMPDALINLRRHTNLREPEEAIAGGVPEMQLRNLLALLRSRTKQDFSGYKTRTLLRRTSRRMGLRQITDLDDYIERLRDDHGELEALAADLTINVTGFFRDPEAWQALSECVVEPLVRERQSEATVRVWVPGCSTGEEAYSIAMLLMEHAEKQKKSFDIKMFATDVARGVLSTARAGMYPASIEEDVGPERLQRFFEMEDDHYYVRKFLRETVTFAPQSLLQDPPFSRMDLISCRNLLIYLEPKVQNQVLALFHFALRENGHLFLGPSETVSGQEELFAPVSKKWRIYRRLGPTRHDVVDFPLHRSTEEPHNEAAPPRGPAREGRSRPGALMEQAILDRYAPASVLIDPRYRVYYLRGPTEDYLRPPRGEPSYNLLAMAREGLQGPLRMTVRRALDEGREVSAAARVRRLGQLQPVRLTVVPLNSSQDSDDRLLVTFMDRDPAEGGQPEEPRPPENDGQLQAELDTTREDLRLTIEQMEAANEELQASNEEVSSMNEELQASNEELETSKEELQSLNEELNTVNNQLQAKVHELEERTADLNNLLNSTEIATLFLDRSLCIRWFTPGMKALLELLPSDIGRPIAHFAPRFSGGDLTGDARQVLDQLAPTEVEVRGEDERWYIQRVLPYRSANDRIDGVVVTFTDITERKRWEWELEGAKEFAEKIVDTIREPLLVLNDDLRVQTANQAFYDTFEVPRDQTEGRLVYELGNQQWDIPALRKLLEEVLPDDDKFSDFVVEHEFETIGRRIMLLNGQRLDHVQQILLAIEDITERHQAEQALKASEARLRKVLETEAVGVMFFDYSGTLIDANDVFLKMSGFTRSEVEARQLHWRDLTPPEHLEASLEQMEQLRRTGRIGPYEEEYFLKDGSRSWMLFAGADLEDGIIVEYCVDVGLRKQAEAALKESEERFRQFGENSNDVLWIVDLDGPRLEYLSPAYERVWGEPRERVMADIGRWAELLHPDDRDEASRALGRLAEGEHVVVEYRVIRASDGDVRWIRDSGFPMRDEQGRVHRAGGLARDITERRRAEEERELLTRELSHRVKNIISVVQSLARQTSGSTADEFRAAFLGRLQALVRAHGLLLDGDWQEAELSELVREAVAAYTIDHPEVVRVEGPTVRINARQGLGLALVLHELGTNAAKYGALAQHDGRLCVTWQVEDTERARQVRLSWHERQGPLVAPPTKQGFGTRLIQHACQNELDGTVELDFAPEGLRCEVVFPVEPAG